MYVRITSKFIIDDESAAQRLKRQINALITEHGMTWNLETTIEIRKEQEGDFE